MIDNNDNRIANLAEKIVVERMDDIALVANEIDELVGTSGHNSDGATHFAADMAAVLDASDAAYRAEAVRFFDKLRDRVKASLQRDAETDAAAEIARFDANAPMERAA